MISLLYGADTYRSRAAFRAFREKAAVAAGTPVKLLRDDALTPAAFQAEVEAQSLFGKPPPLAAERLAAFTGDQAAAVARTLGALEKARRTLIVWEDGVPNAQGIVWRALKNSADTIKEFAPLSEERTLSWIRERLSETGRTMEPAAAQALLAACGTNLWVLASELDKLVLARRSGPLTVADVNDCTPARADADLFAAVRAVVGGDGGTTLRLLVENWRAGEEPRRLFFLAIRELRNLLVVRDGLDRGERLTGWSLASELHLPKAAADALLAAARRTTTAAVRTLFDRCAVAYYHLNTGRADAAEVLESFALASVRGPARTATPSVAGGPARTAMPSVAGGPRTATCGGLPCCGGQCGAGPSGRGWIAGSSARFGPRRRSSR